MKVLLGLLCLLTLVIVVSAVRRLGLYEEAFGFTRDRLTAHAVALWLGGILLAMLMAGGLGRTRWLFPAVTALTALALLGFTAINPDEAIARRNLDRYAQTGKIDRHYIRHLSADAIPVLIEHSDPIADWVLQNYHVLLPTSEPWSSANLSRIKARQMLAETDFWQGAFRDPTDPLPSEAGDAITQRGSAETEGVRVGVSQPHH